MSERTLYRDMALLNTLATLCSQLLHWQTINDATTQNLINHNEALKKALQSNTRTYGIIGSSPALLKAIRELEQVSDSNANVLLLGESGTGKELFARALHTASPRVNKPFIKVNCAAIPESLFESEL
ncbi:sigma 54-interacting transcriptional regulator, partial [Xanthomonas citri pv. citri]